MENTYTATLYANHHIVRRCVGKDINALALSMLVCLDTSNSGSYATITDDKHGTIVQRFYKSAIED